jgi:lipopolysaccharide transport system ATP-binding protein
MSKVALELSHVWKKFRRGEKHNSLRDFIPATTKRFFSMNNRDELQEKEFWALKDISYQVEHHTAIGIIGPNGAGKSTILKLLSGILRPNRGAIKVNGRLSALIEVGAGFHPDLTGKENIYLNGAILNMTRKEIDKKLDEIVEFSGLQDFLDTPVKRYSSGMYARLGFSVAAHVYPDILLVDEVLSVGDMKFQQRCIEKMISIRDNGSTIIFVSHNLESVNILCPETIFLQTGQIQKVGATSEVIREYVTSSRKIDASLQAGAIIDNVILLNASNESQVAFSPGQKARILFEVKTSSTLDECLLGFVVYRVTDGMPICDYNIPINNFQHESGSVIPLSLEVDMNLLRGAYTVSFHILHYPTAKILNRTGNVLTFNVEERVSWQGVSHLNPVLKKIEK